MDFVVAGLVASAAVIFGSGLILAHRGKPYGVGLVTVHKLVSLAAVILFGKTVYDAGPIGELGVPVLTAVVLTALLVVACFATGALLSTNRDQPPAVAVAHRFAPFVAVVSAATAIYLT